MGTRADVDDIVDVLHRYATGIDRRDWDTFRRVFTPDCVGDYGPIGRWTDLDGLTDFMIGAHADLGHTMHRLTNAVVEVDGDEAVARSYVHALLMGGGDSAVPMEAYGYYDDRLVRTDDGWRIATRLFTMVHAAGPAMDPPTHPTATEDTP